MTTAKHYYEVHVTIDPIVEQNEQLLQRICDVHSFRIANLLMRKGGARHVDDMFMTTRGAEYDVVKFTLKSFVIVLKAYGFNVRRYKIEDTLIDSDITDELSILGD